MPAPGHVAALRYVEYYLPAKVETGEQLAAEHPDWNVLKIQERTGIASRHIAGPDECASDLAIAAAKQLFDAGFCSPAEIDFLLFCTQTPDYFLPPSACLIQDRLGLSTSTGALDFNLGSSGFVYGLALAQSLIENLGIRHVLLLTADTYSKLVHPEDRSVRTIFGDAGAAALVSLVPGDQPRMGPYIFGTDGSGAQHLIVPAGGMRMRPSPKTSAPKTDAGGNIRTEENLFMDGGEIFSFTLSSVPKLVKDMLEKAGMEKESIDLFVFHQPNRHMLETIRKQCKIPAEKFFVYLEDCGNTVSATIPIALKAAIDAERLKPGMRVMLVGFGVGLSWAATIIQW